MLEFAVHGMDLSDINSDYLQKFRHNINVIANNFCNNCIPFDTTLTCRICGKTGHNFNGCPYLQNSDKVKEAYICLCMAIKK